MQSVSYIRITVGAQRAIVALWLAVLLTVTRRVTDEQSRQSLERSVHYSVPQLPRAVILGFCTERILSLATVNDRSCLKCHAQVFYGF